MIPVYQTYFYAGDDPEVTPGNCWQASVASVLELPLDEVPHFVDIDIRGGKNWYVHTYMWLRENGYDLHEYQEYPETDEYVLVTGKSPRGDFYHVSVFKGEELAHDPHPDGTGVLTAEYFNVIRPREEDNG